MSVDGLFRRVNPFVAQTSFKNRAPLAVTINLGSAPSPSSDQGDQIGRNRPLGDKGCQIFLGTTYQNGEKYTKRPQNVPNGTQNVPCDHKMYQMTTKCTEWTLNVPFGRKICRQNDHKNTNIFHSETL
jgi:hypothetical protein